MKKTNVLNLSVLILLLTLEISFSKSFKLNLMILFSAAIFFLYQKKWQGILWLAVLPLIPALTTYWSVLVNGSSGRDAWLLLTRTYAFAALGLTFAYGLDLEELLLFLEQKGIAPNFIYGILVVVHALPIIKQEIYDVKEASLFKGRYLGFWSPFLYLKTIFIAFNWRDHYVEAMYSHGYDEGGQRSYYQTFHNSTSGAVAVLLFFGISNVLFF